MPLTNLKESMLHFNCRVYEWASSICKFDCRPTHPFPFVVGHRFCYKYLERYFNDLKKRNLFILVG